ncbi:MAG: cysteine synthase A [Succinivibrio sp.]|uniref:Cysteine synthase n=1 Tax=Succinivibrio dextrinosolvens DSM 3072 TaxID=1123324 RepID=A0A1T4V9G9_9GAMM|nr:cysteine synthase A [Succinivibrio dextrinosolvens]MBQ3679075.1 cysteine synthase A [Succinivibrio sp.]SKA61161.1 cysteine synthase A [Succinivibrio dextrinosolvens DSM 3072]
MKYYKSAIDLIGNTPLVELSNLQKKFNLKARVFAKFEALNPSGSVKDRAALYMIKEALASGKINKDTKIYEPTSGNTGIGLALVCANLGLDVTLVLPETMSVERRNILRAYGAKLVLTEGAKGMKGAIEKATELAAASDNTFIPQQFENEANVKAHYETTGPEIWNDTDGKVDIFVASVGSGGTVSGTGKYLKEKNSSIRVYGVEAAASPVLNGGNAGPHKIQGISAGFIPKIYDKSVVDEVIDITDEEAFDNGRTLAQSEGLFIGISSGAAISAAIKLAQKDENKDKIIVVILPDSGDRYLSTALYHQD